ncbi:MAG: family 2A encapsulin nanocompartment cargo protein cysteine desulfurase [Hyphomicrobium sp.]
MFATPPGQSFSSPGGPSLPGFGVTTPVGVAGPSRPDFPAPAPSPLPYAGTPSTLGTPGSLSPFDTVRFDDNVFNSLFAAVIPASPSTTPSGPSLSGFGASPTELGGQAAGLAGPTPSPSVIHAEPGIGAPITAAPVTAADVSVIDLGSINGLTRATDPLLPSNVDAGPSLTGFGGSKGIPSRPDQSRSADTLPGISQSSLPQPPPATPPAATLSNHTGIETPHSGGTVSNYDPIALPFEAELKSLLAPLSAESFPGAPGAASGSSLYFLDGFISPAGSTGVPGNEAFARTPAYGGVGFDVDAVRRDFPILNETVNGRPLIWFDNAATTQKPRSVIERLVYFYEHENSNIHRAAHELAARATDAYEGARNKVARFLNAGSSEEIIFVRGATEGVNLVAATFGRQHVGPGDEIVITNLEHHANIVPWQQLCLEKGAKLCVAPVDDCGALMLDEFGKLLNSRTKIVAFTQVSNALGTITPAKTIIEMAHRVGARVLVDGAQSVSHMKVDVQDLDADFFVFSGHKLFAPTGIGVVYGKKDLMDSLPPYQSGGNMIRDVTFQRSEFHKSPQRFEAGTGNIADAVGLGAAIDYVERIGLQNIAEYEHKLLVYATERLVQIPGLRIIGTAPEKASVISLTLRGVPSEEIGSRLNKYGIAVRSGHHCAQPILRRFGQETTVRPSFAFYNTCGEIDVLIGALKDIQAETAIAQL